MGTIYYKKLGDYFIPWGSCFVCHSRKRLEKVKYVQHGEYTGYGVAFYFHPSCIEKVIENPESYPTVVLDSCLKVQELISQKKWEIEDNIKNQTKKRNEAIKRIYELKGS